MKQNIEWCGPNNLSNRHHHHDVSELCVHSSSFLLYSVVQHSWSSLLPYLAWQCLKTHLTPWFNSVTDSWWDTSLFYQATVCFKGLEGQPLWETEKQEEADVTMETSRGEKPKTSVHRLHHTPGKQSSQFVLFEVSHWFLTYNSNTLSLFLNMWC